MSNDTSAGEKRPLEEKVQDLENRLVILEKFFKGQKRRRLILLIMVVIYILAFAFYYYKIINILS